jgi:hypothetical protein
VQDGSGGGGSADSAAAVTVALATIIAAGGNYLGTGQAQLVRRAGSAARLLHLASAACADILGLANSMGLSSPQKHVDGMDRDRTLGWGA